MDLDLQVTIEEYEEMRRIWRKAAGRLYQILDAEWVPGTSISTAPEHSSLYPGRKIYLETFNWVHSQQAYQHHSGWVVTREELHSVLSKLDSVQIDAMDGLTSDLLAGKIDLYTWELGFKKIIKEVHILNGVAATGGWQQMTFADWGYIGRRIRFQYDFFRELMYGLMNGKIPVDESLMTRGHNYVLSSYQTYTAQSRRLAMQSNLYVEERRVSFGGACPDCQSMSAYGWVPIGTLNDIGATRCRHNCRCHFEYR